MVARFLKSRKRVKEAPRGRGGEKERESERFALTAQIYQSESASMNLADRLNARGTNESWTGAIPVTEARRERVHVRIFARIIRDPRVGAVELGGKANKTCASLL